VVDYITNTRTKLPILFGKKNELVPGSIHWCRWRYPETSRLDDRQPQEYDELVENISLTATVSGNMAYFLIYSFNNTGNSDFPSRSKELIEKLDLFLSGPFLIWPG
jgi:hypothetical protein